MDKFINKIIQGDALTVLKTMPNESVNCCITSPPYFNLRVYGTEKQIWGGKENCNHVWGQEIKAGDIRFRGQNLKVGNHKNPDVVGKGGGKSNICILCGAWRGELGNEPTPHMYVDHLCTIFDEVKRVLRKDGTLWVNIADSYAGSGGAGGDYNEGGIREGQPKYTPAKIKGIPAKSLIGIPELFAIEMTYSRGWTRRNNKWKIDISSKHQG